MKNIFKKMHSLWMQYFFRDVYEHSPGVIPLHDDPTAPQDEEPCDVDEDTSDAFEGAVEKTGNTANEVIAADLAVEITYPSAEELGLKGYDTFMRYDPNNHNQYLSSDSLDTHRDITVTVLTNGNPVLADSEKAYIQFSKFYTEDPFKDVTVEEYFKIKDKIARQLDMILYYWATGGELRTEFTAKAKEVILHENVSDDGELAVENISGIVSLGHSDRAGETIEIAACKVPAFAAGKALKDAVAK